MTRALCVLILLSGVAANDFGQNDPSVVTAGSGWQFGGKTVKRGETVPAGAALAAQGPDSGSLLLDCGDAGLLSYRCNANGCRIGACNSTAVGAVVLRIDLASEIASPSEMSKSLLRHEPRQAASAGVRAPGNPNDAVLLQTPSGAQFGPALNRVLEGQYCLRLTLLPPYPNQAPVIVRINWDRSVDAEGNASAPGLAAGLYSLDKGSPSDSAGCQVEPDAVASWVVIAPEAAFPKLSTQWKTIAPQIAELSKTDVGRDILVTMRHAALAFLADSTKK